RPGLEAVLADLADLRELPVAGRDVEARAQGPVAAGLLVVARDPVTHELSRDEDRRLDEEGHHGVLDRRGVPVAHEVEDQAGALGARRGDASGWHEALVAAHRVDERDGDVGAECRGRGHGGGPSGGVAVAQRASPRLTDRVSGSETAVMPPPRSRESGRAESLT